MQIDRDNLEMIFEDQNKQQDLYHDVKTIQEKYKFKILDYIKGRKISK